MSQTNESCFISETQPVDVSPPYLPNFSSTSGPEMTGDQPKNKEINGNGIKFGNLREEDLKDNKLLQQISQAINVSHELLASCSCLL